MGRISVVIADRHPVVLLGLSGLLEAHRDFRIVASCSDGARCIEALRNLRPDIAIVDVALPGLSGLELLSIANSEELHTRLVFFTSSDRDGELVASSALNGHSILLKETAPEALLQTLRRIAEGRAPLPLPLSERPAPHDLASENALKTLTDRERQIMRLVSEGLSNKAIGRRLNIADGTIKVHLHHVFQKLQVSNRTVLAALALARVGTSSALGPKKRRPRFRRS
ncbi:MULTISPECIES: response regulator transcription factor [unclassified Bradyrhizobium]|uniref:LuxR C-terminal-related transcriptional regulator n=1 Tax=unclassified Bradyrhizobium TaxID=2631580 RepID=UPI002478DBFE|nr:MULTISPECIES: response regulator transcription factor [unclassified Bradyrhizobium]WGR68749.1 response regulator transcription factor [Bradyrhizobium sp. ISRA426]WGR80804.1 response regulator transcription factor [Bradyrhizobium sp. ISRA430]WGR83989.1 response regulator transcription factor [Bradyrhizobium sp. ISRA432]